MFSDWEICAFSPVTDLLRRVAALQQRLVALEIDLPVGQQRLVAPEIGFGGIELGLIDTRIDPSRTSPFLTLWPSVN